MQIELTNTEYEKVTAILKAVSDLGMANTPEERADRLGTVQALLIDLARNKTCEWRPGKWRGRWFTGCNQTAEIATGSPTAEGMKFCCYCGGHLIERKE